MRSHHLMPCREADATHIARLYVAHVACCVCSQPLLAPLSLLPMCVMPLEASFLAMVYQRVQRIPLNGPTIPRFSIQPDLMPP
jgi:hypothetical protein